MPLIKAHCWTAQTLTQPPDLPRLSLLEKDACSPLHLPIYPSQPSQVIAHRASAICPALKTLSHCNFCLARFASSPCFGRPRTALQPAHSFCSMRTPLPSESARPRHLSAPLASASRVAMASASTAQEALRAWLNLLPPDQQRAAESAMGADWPASAGASRRAYPCSSLRRAYPFAQPSRPSDNAYTRGA